MGFFPVDKETLEYLTFSGRDPEQVKLVEAYCKEQGLFHAAGASEPTFSDTLELDLAPSSRRWRGEASARSRGAVEGEGGRRQGARRDVREGSRSRGAQEAHRGSARWWRQLLRSGTRRW